MLRVEATRQLHDSRSVEHNHAAGEAAHLRRQFREGSGQPPSRDHTRRRAFPPAARSSTGLRQTRRSRACSQERLVGRRREESPPLPPPLARRSSPGVYTFVIGSHTSPRSLSSLSPPPPPPPPSPLRAEEAEEDEAPTEAAYEPGERRWDDGSPTPSSTQRSVTQHRAEQSDAGGSVAARGEARRERRGGGGATGGLAAAGDAHDEMERLLVISRSSQ